MHERIWKNSTMEAWDSNGNRLYQDWPCVVRLAGGQLEILYEEYPDRHAVRYVGKADNYPDFELMGFRTFDGERIGTANLRMTEDEKFLEGTWIEGTSSGDDWCIALE